MLKNIETRSINLISSSKLLKRITILSLIILLTVSILHRTFISYNTNSINTHSINTNTITTQCDIVTNYDNTVVIEYKGNNYKVQVKDGNTYNNSSKAQITFDTNNTKDLKQYLIKDINPL